jgi:hypothetical protein
MAAAAAAAAAAILCCASKLESIFRNRFGQNLRIKTNLDELKFVILTLFGF